VGRGDTDAAASPRLSYTMSYESLTLTRRSIIRKKKRDGTRFSEYAVILIFTVGSCILVH